MHTRTTRRDESFSVDRNGCLTRSVTLTHLNGGSHRYEHRCEPDAFIEITHRIDDREQHPFTVADLYSDRALPHTQTYTAIAFLKDRGIIEAYPGRKLIATNDCIHLDAMTEYHALAHNA